MQEPRQAFRLLFIWPWQQEQGGGKPQRVESRIIMPWMRFLTNLKSSERTCFSFLRVLSWVLVTLSSSFTAQTLGSKIKAEDRDLCLLCLYHLQALRSHSQLIPQFWFLPMGLSKTQSNFHNQSWTYFLFLFCLFSLSFSNHISGARLVLCLWFCGSGSTFSPQRADKRPSSVWSSPIHTVLFKSVLGHAYVPGFSPAL